MNNKNIKLNNKNNYEFNKNMALMDLDLINRQNKQRVFDIEYKRK